MCFSPQADLVGGLVISGIGVDVVRHVHRRRDHMALAALPLILGAHQLDEAFVWWGQEGHVPSAIGHVALWIYLLIAFVLLPIFGFAIIGSILAFTKWPLIAPRVPRKG